MNPQFELMRMNIEEYLTFHGNRWIQARNDTRDFIRIYSENLTIEVHYLLPSKLNEVWNLVL
jgi:hypothetical protein